MNTDSREQPRFPAPASGSSGAGEGGSRNTARRPRADALRNREKLIGVAKQAFTEEGADVSLEEIARRAGVGIGTLYRHFPTRDAMLEAVYRREVEQLAAAADALIVSHAPADALHEWLRLFVDYLGTKKVIAPALAAQAAQAGDARPAVYAAAGGSIRGAMARLVDNAVARGEIRADVDAADLVQALAGFAMGASTDGWQERTLRLVGILVDGLRAKP